MKCTLLLATLAIALTTVTPVPDVRDATVSPEFIDLHYLPQESCKCSEPEPCPPVYVNLKRERANLIKGTGKYGGVTVVELVREEIREVPSHSVVYSETETVELQKIPEPYFVDVNLNRETFEEESDYQEIWIPKVEINYVYKDVHVYAEIEEPVARSITREQRIPAHATHRPVTFNETVFEVPLRHEYLNREDGAPIDVIETIEVVSEKSWPSSSTIQCESLRYVPVPCYPPGQKVPGASGSQG